MKYYVIIKPNDSRYKQESTLEPSEYNPTKYVMIEKKCFHDGSEKINRLIYSDDIVELTKNSYNYASWYNYVIGMCKHLDKSIHILNN